ncbi:MAG: threonine/serine dehydratase [Candidatus Heimdallarchaeota archaeon]|nr:threonine/serine dehydratase [Candidatus Heimdallarchaeota archaeon]
MTLLEEILEAEVRIRPYIKETALEYSPILSKMGNCQVYLKLENQQETGSFKIRGAMNSLIFLSETKSKNYFITASSGNHGVAFTHGVNKLGLKGTIFLPENASPVKVKALKDQKIEITLHGNDCVQAEMYARKYAENNSMDFISPYNDLKIIAGQGTIGIEIENQLGVPDYVLVPVGGGGLISGIAGYLKNKFEEVKIFGCQPINSPVMYESIKAGKIIDYESQPTLSDGTAGGIEPNSITFNYCQNYVDDYILVSEEEIKNALRLLYEEHKMMVEGAAVLTIAAFIQKIKVFQGSKVVLLISGSKISTDDFKKIVDQ